MKKKRLLSLVMAVSLLFGSVAAMPESVVTDSTGITASAADLSGISVKRFAGSDRAETATLISDANKGGMYKTSSTVVIATGFDFHDALVAVPLASAYNAPLLLADRDNLSTKTLAEIKRLKATNVIVVASTNAKDQNGSSAAIGSKVYRQLNGYNVTKLVGSSYYETTKKVAQQLQKKTGRAPKYVFFTTVNNYADALSVSSVAAILKAPIMYVDPKSRLNANTTYYLNSVKKSVNKLFIIGGVNAVSNSVVSKIKAVVPNKTVQRFAGSDRYETCIRINNAFKSTLTGNAVCVAKGYNFPDALAGGVFAAKNKTPLFLADNYLSNNQKKYLSSKNSNTIYVFGGTSALPETVVEEIIKAAGGKPVDRTINISQPEPLVFYSYESDIDSIAQYKIHADYSGTYTAELSEKYNGVYYYMYVTDIYNNKINMGIHDGDSSTPTESIRFDLVEGNDYYINVNYYEQTPAYKLTVYPANSVIDISEYQIINDSFPIGWMENVYSYTVPKTANYDIRIDSTEYLEVRITDDYGYSVACISTGHLDTVLLESGINYTIKVVIPSKACKYKLTIKKH